MLPREEAEPPLSAADPRRGVEAMKRRPGWTLVGVLVLLFFWTETAFHLPGHMATGTCLVWPAREEGALLYCGCYGDWGELRTVRESVPEGADEQEVLKLGEPAAAQLVSDWCSEAWCEVHPISLIYDESSDQPRPSGVPVHSRVSFNNFARQGDLVGVTATDLGAPEADLPGGLRGRRMTVFSDTAGLEYDVWDLALIDPESTETVIWEWSVRWQDPKLCSVYRVEEGKPTWLFVSWFHRGAWCDPIVEFVPGDGKDKEAEILFFQPPVFFGALRSEEWEHGRFGGQPLTGELAKRLPWMVVRSFWRWWIVVGLVGLPMLAVRGVRRLRRRSRPAEAAEVPESSKP